ncbi:uncharacterized protein LOC112461411 [Temnothorax curvispinosus]|uniref:Uncharacterized protein LOC112461411 n=1 Tax=Temnothorax curvispinosus TaxID=300111 RepID=A0A6J1QJ27_9HYME|nr:uncharacterized protein LOC112461411 [Temnothorax curvispinosus]
MSRSSIADSQQEKSMTSQSIMGSSLVTKDITVKTMSSLSNNVLSLMNVPICSDDSISSSLCDESLLSANIATLDQQSPVTSKDCVDDVTDLNNRVQKEIAADVIVTEAMGIAIQKKKVVPAPDRFAVKKQKTTKTVENVLCQPSHAFDVMATAYLQRNSTAQQQQQSQQQHPYITAIAEAMKQVPDEKQLTCFMSIMQVISICLHDKQLPGN